MDVRGTKAYQVFLSQLDEYQQKTAALIGELPLSAGTAVALSEEFHMLKGSAGIFGFNKLTEAAADLEKSLKNPNVGEQTALVTTAAKKLMEVIEAVKRETATAEQSQ